MVELADYITEIGTAAGGIVDGGLLDAITSSLQARSAALQEIGGQLARDTDRTADLITRINESGAALREKVAAIGTPDQERWVAGNLIVGLGNLHTSIDSSVARGAFGRQAVWAVDSLTNMGAVALWQQVRPHVEAALQAEWDALQNARPLSDFIVGLLQAERPEGVDDRDHIHGCELGEAADLVGQAWGKLDSVVAANGRDRSVDAAEWLGIAFDASSMSATSGTAGGGGTASSLDWDTIDLQAVHDANQRVCKSAASTDRLAYVGCRYVLCIGPEHGRLAEQIAAEQGSFNGTVQVKSARIGAGTMVLTGVPSGDQPNAEWAIQQFSKKDVEFA